MPKPIVSQTAITLIVFASLALTSQETYAGNLLTRFFDTVRTYQANFSQKLLDAEGKVVQESSGKLWIKRPGLFRWEYATPFEQKIIGDGKKVWIYDPELRQVTVRDYDKSINQTPAVFLASNKKISDGFLVTDLGTKNKTAWFALKPRELQENFRNIRIGFKNKKLTVLELKDSFDQITRITLVSVKENNNVKNNLFKFIPPEGVDVVGKQ